MNNACSLPSVQAADVVVRVSVLDLDNAVVFRWQTLAGSRKQPITNARFFQPFTLADYYSLPKHQTEIILLLKVTNSVVCYSEIALKITCISLNDVKLHEEVKVIQLDG
jgi:hypothetical protein